MLEDDLLVVKIFSIWLKVVPSRDTNVFLWMRLCAMQNLNLSIACIYQLIKKQPEIVRAGNGQIGLNCELHRYNLHRLTICRIWPVLDGIL